MEKRISIHPERGKSIKSNYPCRCLFHLCSPFRVEASNRCRPSRRCSDTRIDLRSRRDIVHGSNNCLGRLRVNETVEWIKTFSTHPPGHPSSVQCFPFHPVTHKQVPFLHWPCSLHRGSQSFVLQASPSHPSSHWHLSLTHLPWVPQLKSQSSIEQSSPLNFSSQLHFWVCGSNLPWLEQFGRQGMAALSSIAQSNPVQPFLQMQIPSAQNPWFEHVGLAQSGSSQNRPLKPRAHEHFPLMQCPWPLQSGTSHSLCVNWHSLPFQPGLQWHSPFM